MGMKLPRIKQDIDYAAQAARDTANSINIYMTFRPSVRCRKCKRKKKRKWPLIMIRCEETALASCNTIAKWMISTGYSLFVTALTRYIHSILQGTSITLLLSFFFTSIYPDGRCYWPLPLPTNKRLYWEAAAKPQRGVGDDAERLVYNKSSTMYF